MNPEAKETRDSIYEIPRVPATYEDLLLEKFIRDRQYTKYWRTRDGRCIPLAALSDFHLNNILKFIEENREQQEHLEDSTIIDKDYYE